MKSILVDDISDDLKYEKLLGLIKWKFLWQKANNYINIKKNLFYER
jgi:hypothetical protein